VHRNCYTLLHGRLSIVDRALQQSWTDSQLHVLVQNRDVCLFHLHSTRPLGGPRQNIAMAFGVEKLEWFGYPSVEKFEDTVTRFDRIHKRDRRTDRETDGHRVRA